MKTGCVYLVGAGCGEADLITVRGLRLLRRCDAVVYDELIDPALPDEAPAAAQRICMGKRGGRPSASQEEINAALISLAKAGKTVVRLKGGDPFLFGRGGEELTALREAGIPCGEVPGIPSAIGIPAEAGIPVTHRGVSREVHIVTAHTAGSSMPERLDALSRLDGTLVFLMGLGSLRAIADGLIFYGKPPRTPAAVISGGSSPHPATVRGTLEDIAVLAAHVRPPAVIVVGEVAAMELSVSPRLPLSGVSVAVTGTGIMRSRLRGELEPLGARVVTAAASEAVPLDARPDWEKLGDGRVHWLVFTGANGVEQFFRLLRRDGRDIRALCACRFAAIGGATREALAERGVKADLCPDTFTSAALGEALRAAVRPGEDAVLLRSARGTAALPDALAADGIPFEDIPIYTVSPIPGGDAPTAADYLVFASAGGVAQYFDLFGSAPPDAVCVCIGPVTAEALRGRLDRPFLTAREISAAGVADAILRHHGAK